MKVLRIDAEKPDPARIAEAAEMIRSGGLVAFPTETVYGLGGDALNPTAIERIFAAKRRPEYNPLIAHFASHVEAAEFAAVWPESAEVLGQAFWPGPLTLVVRKRPQVPSRLTAGLSTVAVRVPSHPVAHLLLTAAGRPIAAPSANRFTELSPTTAAHVVKGLSERIDLVLDAGPSTLGIESTVVDLSGDTPVLLRPGSLSRDRLETVLARSIGDPLSLADDAPRPSPGMTERHYSPRAPLEMISTRPLSRLGQRITDVAPGNSSVGALLIDHPGDPRVHHLVRMPSEPVGYARELYATLHALDDAGCDLILVEAPPSDPEWSGIRDRLARAAHRR